MADLEVRIKYLPDADTNIPLPSYETGGAAGMDLRANLPDGAKINLEPGERALVSTGFSMEIPQGFEAQIRPRSGLALKNGISLANTPGTIDCDYRGPLGVILINHGQDAFEVHHGDRIAQMVFAPVARATLTHVESLEETARGDGGFGSTGRN